MGIVIFIILIIGELTFLILRLKTMCMKKKEKGFWQICFSIGLCLLLLSSVLQGVSRYSIIISVLFLQACLNFMLHKKSKRPFRKRKAIGSLLINGIIYLAALLPAFIFPQYKPLSVTGDFQVEIAEYTYVDENRVETFSDTEEKRSVTVKFWYPSQSGSYPLVIFSHGAFGVIDSNYSTYMELASHGYVVASIGHPYHAMFVQDVNGKTTIASQEFIEQIYAMNSDKMSEEEIYRNSQEWLKIRTDDINFVLDNILDKAATDRNAPFSRVDKEKIGLFGHSLGGAASVQLGRERKDIDAVIDLEGSMLGECIGFENGMDVLNKEPYPIPLLDVNSKAIYDLAKTVSGDGYVNFYVGERALCFQEVIFNNAGHLNFTDLPIISPPLASLLGVGTVDARECIENVNDVVLTFFDYYLKGEGTLAIEKEY